jgi:hypothetical protein
VKADFDTSEWNTLFAQRFESSWDNVCKFIYYNKSIIPFDMGNRTFRQNNVMCVSTKNGKLYDLDNQEMIDMDESCNIRGLPITWIIINWLKNASTEIIEPIRIESASRKLFERIMQNHEYYSVGGLKIFVLENDCLITYKVHKTCVKKNGNKISEADIEAIITNSDIWSGTPWEGMKRVPLLTNKNAE